LSNGEAATTTSVLHPGLEFVNVMYFKGSYNTQVRALWPEFLILRFLVLVVRVVEELGELRRRDVVVF
jgi:hypothetical protein